MKFKIQVFSIKPGRLQTWFLGVKEQEHLNVNWKGAGRQLAGGITSEEYVAFGEEA